MSARTVKSSSKDYVRPIGPGWWLKRRRYTVYMLRELTCVAVGGYAALLLLLVMRAGDEAAFAELVDTLSHPLSHFLHMAALALVLFHSVTFLNAGPKAIVLYRGEDRVSPKLIIAAMYAGWLAVSAVVTFLVLR